MVDAEAGGPVGAVCAGNGPMHGDAPDVPDAYGAIVIELYAPNKNEIEKNCYYASLKMTRHLYMVLKSFACHFITFASINIFEVI